MTDHTADQNPQFLTMLADLGIAIHRLDRIRDAARLHRQQLIGTSELYAVIEADAPAVSAGVAPATSQASPAVWIDGHPQLEAIAAAVWEHCRTEDTSLVVDDPRNIAVAALAAVLPTTTGRAAVLDAAAQHLYTALFPAVYNDLGQKAAEGVNRAVSELRRVAAEAGPADTVGQDDGEGRPVAYRSPGTRTLYCVTCARQETGWQPLTQVADGAVCDFCGGQVHAIASQALGAVIARHADVEQPETQAEDPARIDRLRPEFTEHASVEAIDAQLQRAHSQQRRWHLRVEWLISLRQTRVTQMERGEWPAVAQPPKEA